MAGRKKGPHWEGFNEIPKLPKGYKAQCQVCDKVLTKIFGPFMVKHRQKCLDRARRNVGDVEDREENDVEDVREPTESANVGENTEVPEEPLVEDTEEPAVEANEDEPRASSSIPPQVTRESGNESMSNTCSMCVRDLAKSQYETAKKAELNAMEKAKEQGQKPILRNPKELSYKKFEKKVVVPIERKTSK